MPICWFTRRQHCSLPFYLRPAVLGPLAQQQKLVQDAAALSAFTDHHHQRHYLNAATHPLLVYGGKENDGMGREQTTGRVDDDR